MRKLFVSSFFILLAVLVCANTLSAQGNAAEARPLLPTTFRGFGEYWDREWLALSSIPSEEELLIPSSVANVLH